MKWMILALFLLVLMLNLVCVDWGLPSHYSWAPDVVHPYLVFNAAEHSFSNGWFDKYPPLHYMMLSVLYAPVLWMNDSEQISSLESAKEEFYSASSPLELLIGSDVDVKTLAVFFYLGRGLAAFMGAMIFIATFLAGRELFNARAGLMAALIASFHPITIFYSHTMNTETPYFMWSVFGVYFYFRALKRQDLTGFIGLGTCVALAAATKEQSFALFVLLPFVLIYVRASGSDGKRPGPAALLRALSHKTMLAGAGVFLLTSALANNLIFNAGGYIDHLKFNAPGVSVIERLHPLTFEGCMSLTWESLFWIRETATLPVICVCVLGLILAFLGKRRAALAALLPAFSYFVVFIVYIGFVTPRYITPVFFILALFGGYFLSSLWTWQKAPTVIRVACVSLFLAYIFVLGAGVDFLFGNDPRNKAEAWIERNIPEGSRVLAFSSPKNSICRLPGGRTYYPVQYFEGLARLRELIDEATPDFLIVQIFHGNVFGKDPSTWLPKMRDKLGRQGFDVKEVIEPAWPHPCLSHLFLNPLVILAERRGL